MKAVLLLSLTLHALVPVSVCFGEGYQGFKQVKPEDCVALDATRVQALPSPWHKYRNFVKICPVKKNEKAKAVVSIVSVWTEDYLHEKEAQRWEDFPYTIIVDDDLREVGTLPVIFPVDAPTEPVIYCGKWKDALPTEIRVDVRDPTVAGDYYYPPVIWNDEKKRYEATGKESISGSRPQH